MPVRIMQAAPLMVLFSMFSMRGHEMQVFQMLMKRPMTIKQLQRASHMSERILRDYLNDLTKRKLVSKKVVEDKRLKYVYYANPPETILGMAKDIINRMEKRRIRMRNDIVRGSEKHTQWRG